MSCKKNPPRECEQFIAFLIRQDKRIAYIDITSSKDPAAVLRRHWRGDDAATREYFSQKDPKAEPVMWLWKAGKMTRSKAKAYVVEWESMFEEEGYEIAGSRIDDKYRQEPPLLSIKELLEVRKLRVSQLLSGEIGTKIECGAEGGGRRTACQKFLREPTYDVLRIRAKGEVVNRFRDICDDRGLTMEQGIELLMASYTGNPNHLIVDLWDKLERANDCLMQKDDQIEKLREALRKSEEGKEYPKKYRRAELQGKLLKEFFKRLPEPRDEERLRIFSSNAGRYEFPQASIYKYPEKEGVIALTLEHARYSRGHYACFFIYGRDAEGNYVKIRTYSRKENHFGVPLRSSPFFYPGAVWLFSVQAEGEAMEIVGSLPDPGCIRFDKQALVRETEEQNALYLKEAYKECDKADYDFLNDTSLSIDKKIKIIADKKQKNNA